MEKLKELKRKYYIVLSVVIILEFIFMLVVSSMNTYELFPLLIFSIPFSVIILVLLYNQMVKKPFKEEFVPIVLKEINPNISYNLKIDGYEYKKFIQHYKLIQSATTYRFTDVIDDEIDSIKYRSMDLHATHTQSNGKSSTTVTDFKGKVYEVFIGNNYCNYILKEEKWKRTPDGYTFLDLESIDFNSKFNLYVSDTHEAHKIFTPSRILNLIELEKKYDNIMTIVHIESKLYILSYDKEDQFEDMGDPKESIIRDYNEQLDFLKCYLSVIK